MTNAPNAPPRARALAFCTCVQTYLCEGTNPLPSRTVAPPPPPRLPAVQARQRALSEGSAFLEVDSKDTELYGAARARFMQGDVFCLPPDLSFESVSVTGSVTM